MFEAKSYNDLRKTIAGANVVFGVAFLISVYELVLTPGHKQDLITTVSALKLDPLLSSIITIALLAAVWGYLTTALFRLHDWLYEPHIVSWRASYDADLILRSLCFAYARRISPRFFEAAFTNKTDREAFMQRLFYRFIGDSKSPHEELRERFYAVIRNYWLIVLAEVYCVAFLITAVLYRYFNSPAGPLYGTLLIVAVVSLLLRVWANRYLPKIRPITIEQIGAVLREHKVDFEKELDALLDEYSFNA